jgi:CBS domain-containing protein
LIISGAIGDRRMPEPQRIRGEDGRDGSGIALAREDIDDHVGRMDAFGYRLSAGGFHRGERIPRIRVGARMAEAIVEMSSKGFGCVGVFDGVGALVGIITDGDLRRHLKSNMLVDTPVEEVMTRAPRTIAPDALVAEALELVSRKISALLVVENGDVVGIVHFHDLLRLGAA